MQIFGAMNACLTLCECMNGFLHGGVYSMDVSAHFVPLHVHVFGECVV